MLVFDGNMRGPLSPKSKSLDIEIIKNISLFSDYTKMVTMQNLFHDGGFSNTGVSKDVIDLFGSKV